jgi:hypothetical protein
MEEMFRKKAEATRVSPNVLPFPSLLSTFSPIINEPRPINKMQKIITIIMIIIIRLY